jgi:putative ABC transport system permease protein
MTLLHRVASVARWMLRRDRAERELNDELQAFVDLSAADKVREGVPPEQARRLAVLELGGVEQAKERVRTGRHGASLDEIGRDVRYAWRMLGKQRGFTAVVILTLALGIGANTAIFTLIDALLLRWLPVHNPHELVLVTFRSAGEVEAAPSFSYVFVRRLSDQRDIFSGVAGFSGNRFTVGSPGAVTRVRGALVTGGYYETLGVSAVVGRLLTREDDEPGAPLVAVISHSYWDREFGRRPTVVGERLLINAVAVSIVGVSPRGFDGANVGAVAEITIPVAALAWVEPKSAPLLGAGNFWLRVLARPSPQLGAAQAEARLRTIWPRVQDELLPMRWPAPLRRSVIEAVPQLLPGATGWTYLREIYARPLLVLMGAAALVLVIACANIASLHLARGFTRKREIAVRLAIGAGRGRVMRQLLVESTMLSCIGAACGIALAWLSGTLLVDSISTESGQMVFDLMPNWRVLAFTAALAVITAVAFGLAPAVQATAAGPLQGLKDDPRIGTSRSRLLPWLVSAQVALSLVLLVGAALFVRTLQNLQRFNPGFDSEGVLLVDLEQGPRVPRQLLEELQRGSGAVSVSVSTHTPLSGSRWSEPAVPAGQPLPESDNALFVGAGPRFFETMGIPLLSGREFTERDAGDVPSVAVVNEAFARRHFPDRNPVGQHLTAQVRGQTRDLEIVGLVTNTSATGLRVTPPATVYVAYAQLTGNLPTALEVRANGGLARAAAAVQQTMRRHYPNAPIEVRPLSAQVQATLVRERMLAALASAFGILAMVLAAIGLYGLLAYRVTQRTKEIGIRMAVGARRAQVVALVLKGATVLVTAGIAVGAPAAWAASRWIEAMLFGVTASDPAAVGGAIGLLCLVALVAAYLPAWRASRVDPLPALRHE